MFKKLPRFQVPSAMCWAGLAMILSLGTPAFAQNLPNVVLKDIEGNAVQTTSKVQRDGPTVFCFWATWCNPCKVEMPLLEKLHQTLKGDKFTVLGLHVGPGPENIEEFKKLMPMSFPIYVDMELEVNWGVPGLPTTFLLNPEGKLIYRAVGKREFASEAMINFLTKEINKYDCTQHQSTKYSLKNK